MGFLLLMMTPAAQHLLAELVLPGMVGLAALTPVQNKIFQLVQGELARDVVI